MQPTPPYSAPHLLMVNVNVWATSLLGVAIRQVICGVYLFIYFFSWLCCPPRFQNCPQTCQSEGFLVFGNFSSFKTPSPGWVSMSNSCLSFHLLYFVLPPFHNSRLPFWVPGVLHQHSKFVLWYLLSSNNLLMNLWGRTWSPRPIPLPS